MRPLVLALALVPSLAAAEPQRLTLDQVIAKAVASPKVEVAIADHETAQARHGEALAQVLPRVKVTAFTTASPEIHCDNVDCTQTSPTDFAFRFSGLYAGANIEITQPLITFGKATHGFAAVRAGVTAKKALADEAAGDAASDAAKAYWGLKLARELGYMLDDGIEQIQNAQKGMADRTDVSVQDRQRVAVLLAEAKAQRADAAQAEAQALAGLRAITNDPDADIDEDEIAAVEHALPTAAQLAEASTKRPQSIAAQAGAKAAAELQQFQHAYYYPDIALVGSANISGAQGADNPPSVFANDPYNRRGVALVLTMQWQLEPWNVRAKVERARAEAHKAKAQSELAELGARYDAATELSQAIAAKAKVDATAEGEKAGRAWVASVLQNEAVGTAEAKDLADAYLAWFQVRAHWLQAVFQWNVAVVRLGRATGEFRASSNRQR